MGVAGLQGFIKNNDDLLIKNYHLRDTPVIIDANNLISKLFCKSQVQRSDLFGGDLVAYGRLINQFFSNFKQCNIEPILVFDGAAAKDDNKSIKLFTQKGRAYEKFRAVMNINRRGFGQVVLPLNSADIFRSIAADLKIKIIQCMFEADYEVARLSNVYKAPVISNDSDFFIFDMPHGLIMIDNLNYLRVNKEDNSIECDIFKQDHFIEFFPGLDRRNLPILAILAGNDLVDPKEFAQFCSRLPLNRISDMYGVNSRQLRNSMSYRQLRILQILYYLCGKTQNEITNQICDQVPSEKRNDLKKLVKNNIKNYEDFFEEDFGIELGKIYRKGFFSTYRKILGSDEELDTKFEEAIEDVKNWIKSAMENSNLHRRILQLIHRDIIFIRSNMDDPRLPSAQLCQERCLRVLMALSRPAHNSDIPCIVYDRVAEEYERSLLKPLDKLEKFGPLDYLMYDVPKLTRDKRVGILLATFYCSPTEFAQLLAKYDSWFDKENTKTFALIRVLMDFIDKEGRGAKLWDSFRTSTLLCFLYYILKDNRDKTLIKKKDSKEKLLNEIKRNKFEDSSRFHFKQFYNCTLMHQITQLQASILSFNILNAFLGEIMQPIRAECWLNCCLIYNLTEGLHKQRFKVPSFSELLG